eukprot:TRINITY_DN9457_c1_g1_i1.p1 TRINITY_DN9457_c1_g1~~TRINITY_DN9457_c1_g1_i1.p1  ORF type:complete len:939 (-),score=162.83 TRINITY_DN9457_c1_g1_i1:82-2898(-)
MECFRDAWLGCYTGVSLLSTCIRHLGCRSWLRRPRLRSLRWDPPRLQPSLDGGVEDVRELEDAPRLFNDLFERQWPYISEWVGVKVKELLEPFLKDSVEPMLRKAGDSGATLRVDYKVGTLPRDFQLMSGPLTTSTCDQSWPDNGGTSETNYRFVGKVECSQFGRAKVVSRIWGVEVVCVELEIMLVGTAVFELLMLSSRAPPWFSGFRAYFPDLPDITFSHYYDNGVVSKIVSAVMSRSLRDVALDRIRRGVRQVAVLPNRFATPLGADGDAADPFCVKHPRPLGVLRLRVKNLSGEASPTAERAAVEEVAPRAPTTPAPASGIAGAAGGSHGNLAAMASGANGTEGGASGSGAGASWVANGPASGTSRRSSAAAAAAASDALAVKVTLGADTVSLRQGEACDLLLADPSMQRLRLAAPSSSVGAGAELQACEVLAEVLGRQQDRGPEGSYEPSEYEFCLEAPEAEDNPRWRRFRWNNTVMRRYVNVVAQWRPFVDFAHAEPWSVGDGRLTRALFLDLYHATGLPAAGAGVMHVAEVSVRPRGSERGPLGAAVALPASYGSGGPPSAAGSFGATTSAGGSFAPPGSFVIVAPEAASAGFDARWIREHGPRDAETPGGSTSSASGNGRISWQVARSSYTLARTVREHGRALLLSKCLPTDGVMSLDLSQAQWRQLLRCEDGGSGDMQTVDCYWEQFFCCLLYADGPTSDLMEKVDVHVEIFRKAAGGKDADVRVGSAQFPLSLLEGLRPDERLVHSLALRSDEVEHSFGRLKLGLQLRQLAAPPPGRYAAAAAAAAATADPCPINGDAPAAAAEASSSSATDADGISRPPGSQAGAARSGAMAAQRSRRQRSVAEGEWKPDDEAPACTRCGDSFSFSRRRHHCRNCGDVVCFACSKERVVLPRIDAKALQRVCDSCAEELREREHARVAILAELDSLS